MESSIPLNKKENLRRRASIAASDQITSLYEGVKNSHTLYQLGLDEDGNDAGKSKMKSIKSFFRRKKDKTNIDSRILNFEMSTLKNKSNNTQNNAMISMSKEKRNLDHRLSISKKTRQPSNFNSYKVRSDKFSQFYSKLVLHVGYKLFSVFVSLCALYMRDVAYATLPKEADTYTLDVTLSIVFFFLFSELILYSLTHQNYGFTFFFWLDLVGTASILIDIPWIMLGFGLDNNVFLIVKGGRMGRAARGAGSVRFIKLIKMIRMIKLFRIVQLFRKKHSDENANDEMDALVSSKQKRMSELDLKSDMETELKPTKMGSLLADRVTQKVILGVLLSFLILPLFDVGNMDVGDKTFIALEDLEWIYTNHHNASNGQVLLSHVDDYKNSMMRFDTYHENVLFLEVSSNMDNYSLIEYNRTNIALRSEERTQYFSESGASSAVLDIRQNVQQEAILNICLTTFIISIFAIGSFVISIDAFILVYPLEYLVVVLKKLTAIAVEQAAASDSGRTRGDNNVVDEDVLFSSIMKSMTDIFYSGQREKMFIQSVNKPRVVNEQKIRKSMEFVERFSIAIKEELDLEI